jgi:hypothetical protein
MTRARSRTAVSISAIVIANPPSPASAIVWRFGRVRPAAIAAGSA